MNNKQKPKTNPDLGVWTPAVVFHNLENLNDEDFFKVYKASKSKVAQIAGLTKEPETVKSTKDEGEKLIDVKPEPKQEAKPPKKTKKATKKTAKKKAKEVKDA